MSRSARHSSRSERSALAFVPWPGISGYCSRPPLRALHSQSQAMAVRVPGIRGEAVCGSDVGHRRLHPLRFIGRDCGLRAAQP